MPKLDCPLQLTPVLKPKIWGRPSLAPLFPRPPRGEAKGAKTGNPTPIGEAWITDDRSRFLNGPLADITLAEASETYGPELNGSRWTQTRFPLLAKYIFTGDWLSVQVHPDDDYARLHDPSSPGKFEMWYFVKSDRRAAILMGLRRPVSKESLRAAFEAGTSRELLRKFRPRAGEAAFIPPGLIHALGPGLVLFEVEENSDLTYRLDDFGRLGLDGKPRPLHLDKGLDVARLDAPALRNLPLLRFREPYGFRRYVAACPHFALEELTIHKPAGGRGSPERVEVFSVLEGEGRVETDAGWMGYHPGDTWLIPPAAGRFRFMPTERSQMLKFYVPDLDRDFRQPLSKRGVAQRKIDRICFG